ncbi:Transcription factor AFT [Phytophthora cactorum]|nr:Transcription factor AFT [Phytophthora cactorum]
MARKHTTARTKQQMADEVLREQEARQAEEARQKRLREARTRSEKSRPLAQAEAKRERAPANEEVEKCRSAERKLDVAEENQEKGEEGQNEGDSSRERTSGKRTTHNLRGMACPFQVLAQLQQRVDTWVVVLKRENNMHNHPVLKDIYMNYPGIRQVPSNSALIPGIELQVETRAASTTTFPEFGQ